jgi:hypothetical protein
MSAPVVEAFLARLYTESALRREFVESPVAVSLRAGLTEEEAVEMAAIDMRALEIAADSYAHKREGRRRPWYYFGSKTSR